MTITRNGTDGIEVTAYCDACSHRIAERGEQIRIVLRGEGIDIFDGDLCVSCATRIMRWLGDRNRSMIDELTQAQASLMSEITAAAAEATRAVVKGNVTVDKRDS